MDRIEGLELTHRKTYHVAEGLENPEYGGTRFNIVIATFIKYDDARDFVNLKLGQQILEKIEYLRCGWGIYITGWEEIG